MLFSGNYFLPQNPQYEGESANSEIFLKPEKKLISLKKHNLPVSSLKFSDDGKYLFSGSCPSGKNYEKNEDFTVFNWSTENWDNFKQYDAPKEIIAAGCANALFVSPNNKKINVGAGSCDYILNVENF